MTPAFGMMRPGTDLLSRFHYHRPRLLDFRVRDGFGYFQPGMCTGPSFLRKRETNGCEGLDGEIQGEDVVKPIDWLVPVG